MSSGSAGGLPSSTSALSPRSLTQSGSPTGATAASPSSAPRSTIDQHARIAALGARQLAADAPRRTARRSRAAARGATVHAGQSHGITSSGIRATSTAAPAPAGGSRRARPPGASRPTPAGRAPSRRASCGSTRSCRSGCAKLLAMSSRCARPSIQAPLVVGKSLRRRRPPQRLAEQRLRVCTKRADRRAARAPAARSAATIHSLGRLSLCAAPSRPPAR